VQHIFIGAAAANAVVIGWGTVQNLRKISWLSRYSLAILVATGTGLGLRSVI